jgi:hypothetical protein
MPREARSESVGPVTSARGARAERVGPDARVGLQGPRLQATAGPEALRLPTSQVFGEKPRHWREMHGGQESRAMPTAFPLHAT